MIPVKLTVHNFMCYRENVPPLYFDGIHTACISGDNGNGKSALIDAVTWALWGKTRAKSDDDLVHQGEVEVGVEFDFRVGQQLYRIIRRRARPRRRGAAGQVILELQIANRDGLRSISGSTIHETQKKISEILHMDYDTFVNSAFLRQGHADEFTVKRPVERKEVLADILGLFVYDELEEQSKNLVKQQETGLAQLESTIRDIDDELARKPDYEASFSQAQRELAQIEELVNEQNLRLVHLRQERESLENKRLQLFQLEEHIAGIGKEIRRWEEQADQHCSRLKEYEEIIARRAVIEEGYARFADARKLCDELDDKLRQSVVINESKHHLEMAIERAQAALLGEHKLAQSRLKELEAKARELHQLKEELHQVELQRRRLSLQEETLNNQKKGLQEKQAEVNYLESATVQLEREVKDMEDKLKMLLSQHEARCPLCETELGREGLRLVETKYATERGQRADSLKLKRAELAGKRERALLRQSEIHWLEERLNQGRTANQSRAGILSKEINEAEVAQRQLEEERQRLADVERRLAGKEFAAPEQRALAELEAELTRLNYDSPQHDELRQRLSHLQQYESPKRRLEEADRLIEQEWEAASRAGEAIRQRSQSLEAESQKKKQLALELEALPRLYNDLTQAEAEYKLLDGQQKQAQEMFWSMKAKLERCSELEVKKREKEKLLSRTLTEERIYRDLAQAFGKKGIQAMLIETALPEIEVEANKLLARMTDNRMHVKIETQRQTKKGDVTETLDINISDELGMRSYEMFSGGEAFRINFAIRIALSKLLTRRVGAPLRTLIIDEGFGTQDSHGIEKIKEAINSIQDDFDKILVITHIEEFRDAFPTRIDVVKTGDGSTIEVS